MPSDPLRNDDGGPGAPLVDGPPIELVVGTPAAGGSCVARTAEGRVVFVRHALPGERVRARVTTRSPSYWRADAVEILDPSEDRVAPPCRHAGPGRCGGCDYQHVTLARQRAMKAELVAGQLRHLAGVDRPVVVEEADGAPGGLGWRTRVQFAVGPGDRTGLRRHRSHEIEPIDRCLIAAPGIEALGVEGRTWPGVALVEVSTTPAGDRALVSVTTRRGRRPALPPLEAGLVVDGTLRRRPGTLSLEVKGRRFRVGPGSFWQVHRAAPALLAEALLAAADPRTGQQVVDLFAGVGLFSSLLAEAVGSGGSVLAVERDAGACADARANTADQPRVRVMTAAVTGPLIARSLGRPDLVTLDPPRSGAGRQVMAALAGLRPSRIVYLACDPASFARDVRVLLDAGWRLSDLRAFDLFPMTEHVELLGLLEPPPG